MSDTHTSAPLPMRALDDVLGISQGATGRATRRVTGGAQIVTLPPMPTGQHLLEQMPIRQVPEGTSWRDTTYVSAEPRVHEFREALVHGGAGIVRLGLDVVLETLFFTNTVADSYDVEDAGVRLRRTGPVHRLGGTALSLLSGEHDDYARWTLECQGRLAALEASALAACTHVLVPRLTHEFQRAGLAATGLPRTHAIREVGPGEAVDVRRLVLPGSVVDDARPHPCVRDFFARLGNAAAEPDPDFVLPRIYIDQRGQSTGGTERMLDNEDAVVAALEPLGFVPIRMRDLPLARRIALIRHAEIVVATHGAGLADLVYAAPGCRVVELLMNGFVHWRYRRLAAVLDLPYDCVLGRVGPPDDPMADPDADHWIVSVTHVLAAVQAMLAQAPPSH